MQIFFSVGEPSGDQHAAHLIDELRRRRPDVDVVGYGGPLMQAAGCRLQFRLTDLAVMGFLRVVPLLWMFYRLVRQASRFFRENRPDAVVLVDFPGFNWWIARKAKAAGIPVFYYLPPQLWAWASWRIGRIRRFVDHVLCGLPFEPKWYADRGIEVEYVGHPFFDEVADSRLDRKFLAKRAAETCQNVGILPGSRNQEVRRNWPVMLEVMQRLHARHPDVRFHVACYKQSHRDCCRNTLKMADVDLPVQFHVGHTPEIIELSRCCLMVSGSVSLEMLARTTPAVILYRTGRLTKWIFSRLIVCHYITLPNLFADRDIMPEFPFAGDPAPYIKKMTEILSGWLGDRQTLFAKVAELKHLRDQFGQTGATQRTAETILNHLSASEQRCAA